VGLRAGLDAVAKRNSSAPAGNLIPIVQPVTSHYTDRPTPALNIMEFKFNFTEEGSDADRS